MQIFCCVPFSNPPSQPLKAEESLRYRTSLSDAYWQILFAEIAAKLARLPHEPIQFWGRQVRDGMQWLDPIMTRYCRQTCPTCEDPCCMAKGIFFNQADLLYLAACGATPPPGQTRTRAFAPCRYLAADGCQLQRTHRPYVCVWFLCDAQTEIFLQEPLSLQRQFSTVMQQIRTSRLNLEWLYEFHYPPLPQAFPVIYA